MTDICTCGAEASTRRPIRHVFPCALAAAATAGKADRGRGGMNARWGDQFVIAEPEPFPNKVTWRTYLLRPIWWLVSRVTP